METDINRLKVVLAEKKRTNKWLCEQLNVNPSTVSKWCTNSSQPDIETLVKIANLLEVELADLVNKQCLSNISKS
ncbi:MAG: helix-turn-helix domain-containing protein [Muribaculaceae bacterium]|nr:helix-turn-helix domain-containing protein [Muribaculaceae bacterium]